jgi:hypothetical protein
VRAPNRFRRRTLVAALLGLPSALLAAAPPVAAGPARMTISPTSRDGEFKIDSRGFFKDEDVSTWLTGPSQQIVRTNDYASDDRGRVKFRIFMLRHYQPGRWALTIVGQRSREEAIEYFESPDRGVNATAVMSATSLNIGDTVTVTGDGFKGEERISFWFTLPDGSAARGASDAFTDRLGNVTFSFVVARPDLEIGGWALSVYGYESDRYAVTPFEVV